MYSKDFLQTQFKKSFADSNSNIYVDAPVLNHWFEVQFGFELISFVCSKRFFRIKLSYVFFLIKLKLIENYDAH